MREVSDKDKLFYFEKHFFTLDGLWMIEIEEEFDWETALKLDLKVWIRLLAIIMRRIKRYLNIETNTLHDLVEILTFRWSVENWKYEIIENLEKNVFIKIKECPYQKIMERNPDRNHKAPLICKDMCVPFYEAIVKNFNPNIKLIRDKLIGLGDENCTFHLKVEDADGIK